MSKWVQGLVAVACVVVLAAVAYWFFQDRADRSIATDRTSAATGRVACRDLLEAFRDGEVGFAATGYGGVTIQGCLDAGYLARDDVDAAVNRKP